MPEPSNELAGAIRDALSVGEIDAADLARPTLRAPGPRRVRPLLAVAASVVVVAVLAVVLAVTLGRGGTPGPAVGGTADLAGLAGHRWRVVTVQDADGTFPAPRDPGRSVGYTRDGYVLGDDGVNALQGRYDPTSGGYVVHDSASTAVGGTGGSGRDERATAAVDAMFFTLATSLTDTPPDARVTVHLTGTTLTLHTADVTLTLRRGGPQPDFSAGASATPTRTG